VARYGLKPDRCIVVEDSERGLAAARAAGLECLIVRTEWSKDGDFSKARRVVDSVAEAGEEVLRRLGKRVE
jgi:beta-phosphoglucomutase-like phosphatase (HAD superfamily)